MLDPKLSDGFFPKYFGLFVKPDGFVALVTSQNHLVMEDLIDHQELERKKVSATKENLALVTSQNHLVMEDLIDHQELERKKVSATKENLALVTSQNHLVLQITQNILEKNHLKV